MNLKCVLFGQQILCKGFINICWPNTTEEEKQSWKQYCLDKQEKARGELIID